MFSLSTISARDRVDFAKSLSVMLKSGISIDEALAILSEQHSGTPLGGVVSRIKDRIVGGSMLSGAFEPEQKALGPIFIGLIKAGERSGTLQENLDFLADLLERSNDLKKNVKSATLYPKLVFGAAFLLGGGLAVFILPRLVPLFSELDVELPLITQILLNISLFLQEYWLLSLIGLVVCVAVLFFLHTIPGIRYLFHSLYIRVPFVGQMIKHYQLALLSQLFAVLTRSGLSLNESVPIVAEAMTNERYRRAVGDMQERIEHGQRLSESMRLHPKLYSPMSINIIDVGERSGTLSDSFDYLAEYYNKEVTAEAKRLPTIIEPLLLVGIAVVVGFVALAVIMPVYELTGSITQ